MTDTTAYGPTATVGTQDQLAPAMPWQEYHTIPYTNATGTDIPIGGVVVIGGIPMVAVEGIANGKGGTLTFLEGMAVLKDASVFAQGDAVYWNASGSSLLGTPSAGTATSNASGANFMGFAAVAALTGDSRVKMQLHGLSTGTVNVGTSTVASTGVTAAGTNYATGGVLASGMNVVTSLDSTKGVSLPATPIPGTMVIVKANTAGQTCPVYPDGAAEINAVGSHGPVTMGALTTCIFVASSATQWFTIPLVPS